MTLVALKKLFRVERGLSQRTQITQRECRECSRLHYFADKDSWCCFGGICVNQRNLRETLGVLLCGLIEYAYVNILPQITQRSQMNAAGLHYFADIIACEVVVVLGFVCVNLRNQRETLGFLYAIT